MLPVLHELEQTFAPSPLVRINDDKWAAHQVELWLKRDDLLHPIISGNKWRKLKYILNHALSLEKDTVVSMGGAYSNHLHALAYAGKMLGIKTVGFVRGEPAIALTPTLHDAKTWGMELRYVTRTDYRLLRQYKDFDSLPNLTARQYWLPEGGAHSLALQGVAELVAEIDIPYDTVCVACGTGTTLAGIVSAVPEQANVLGIAALKHADFLNADVQVLFTIPRYNWHIHQAYHFGGYAKTNAALLAFIEEFKFKTKISLEPVYTGKMMYALYDLLGQGYFKPGQRIVAIHTGGLQGNRGDINEQNIRTGINGG